MMRRKYRICQALPWQHSHTAYLWLDKCNAFIHSNWSLQVVAAALIALNFCACTFLHPSEWKSAPFRAPGSLRPPRGDVHILGLWIGLYPAQQGKLNWIIGLVDEKESAHDILRPV